MKKRKQEEDYTSYDTYDSGYDDSGRDDSYDDGYDDYYDEPYDEGYDEEYPEDYEKDDGYYEEDDGYYEEDDYAEEAYDDDTRYSRGGSYDDSYDDDRSYRRPAPRQAYSSDYEEDDDEYEDDMTTPHKEHFFIGLLGAFVLALVGAALYFVGYQFGYVLSICGLVTYLISYLGYCACSRARFSGKGIVISLLFTIIVLFAAEFLCISSTIYQEMVDTYNISFLEALKMTPDSLKNQDILKSFMKELGLCYICSLIGLIPTAILSFIKKK